jgi:hypothetical protein
MTVAILSVSKNTLFSFGSVFDLEADVLQNCIFILGISKMVEVLEWLNINAKYYRYGRMLRKKILLKLFSYKYDYG